uniref:Uncharacterized protein n=1 Tax=Arundo donax TaxID=35708 RepID=A0A0A9BW46_ARUDO
MHAANLSRHARINPFAVLKLTRVS